MLAMTLTAMTAVAQAQPTGNDTVGLFGRGERASQEQPSSDSVKRAAEAQERYYSTWRYGDTPAQAPAQPSRQSSWLVLAIGVLAAALALLSVLAAMFAFASSCRSGR